ncbi:MAG TPA: DUF4331 family protein [Polyangiaceae bacterium]|nr:DUF4331 family protein [Polyangiaceae bacterium]
MRNQWWLALGVPAALGAGLLFVGSRSNAADHLDAPGAIADPAADINDLYVFRSKDTAAGTTERTVFVMTVNPLATAATRFSDKVDYEFRISDKDTPATTFTIKCTATADATQKVTCAIGSDTKTVDFDAVEAGDAANDNIRVFAGLRDDPFFIDLPEVQDTLKTGKPDKMIDGTGVDFLAGKNVLTLVVDLKNSVFGSSTKLKVHAVTVRK